MRKKLFVAICILVTMTVLLLVYAAGAFYQQNNEPLKLASETIDYQLLPGTSTKELAFDFYHKGWIQSPNRFRYWIWLNGNASQLKAGLYQLHKGMSAKQLVELLVSGKVQTLSITFIEGTRAADAIKKVKMAPWVKLTSGSLSERLSSELVKGKYPSLEGLFYPSTYYYHAGDTDFEIMQRAYVKMQKVLHKAWKVRSKNLPYKTPYEALTMASIVEEESAVSSERKEIAGVFIRRIQKRMRLQTDPTVIYGLKDNYNGRLTYKDLRKPTPYNTYVIWGLPPTPIALPGKASVYAALQPTQSHYLYFVAKGDGTHQFSSTLSEHNQAVRKYQRKRRKNYRSTPLKEDSP